jgi:hypothetical protein
MYHIIARNAQKIIKENPNLEELKKMEKLNSVNCLKRGNFDTTQGRRYMVCVDGSESSKIAFMNTVQLIDPTKDHLFLVTGNKKSFPKTYIF